MFDDFNQLLQHSQEASLGSLKQDHPFVSSVGFLHQSAKDSMGTLVFLLSDLANHTQNLKLNPNVSVLVVEPTFSVPIFEKKRLTLSGSVKLIDDKKRFTLLKSQYVVRYPKSEIFFTLPDFKFYEFFPSEIHWISGFAQTTRLSLKDNSWQKVSPVQSKL